MKVVVIAGSILPISQTFIKEQVRSLKRWQGILAGAGKERFGVNVKDINVLYLPGSLKWSVDWWVVRILSFLNLRHLRTYRILRKQSANLVHVHFADVAVRYWPILRKLGLPVLITIHGTDINTYKSWWESGKEGILNKGYPNKLLNITKDPRVHFLAVSQSIKDRAIEFGIPEEKISVEYIGVDVERFKTSGLPLNKRSNKILFVGRMIENKGPLVLLDALKSVINKVPDATLTMIGDGPLLEEAKKVADEYALPVNFLGAQPTEKVIDELNQSKVFCLPSYTLPSGKSEGMPIVTLEAQSCGVPVVTSARGASTEGIIDGVTGFRFKEMCIEELSHRLVNVLVDEAFMLTASESCRDFICDRFDINLCNQSLERIYDEHTRL